MSMHGIIKFWCYRPLVVNIFIFLYEEVPTSCFFILIIISLRKNRNEENIKFEPIDINDISDTFS